MPDGRMALTPKFSSTINEVYKSKISDTGFIS